MGRLDLTDIVNSYVKIVKHGKDLNALMQKCMLNMMMGNGIPDDDKYAIRGTPQGSPISPLISILALKDFLSQKPSISYADDPIFYDQKPFEIKGEPEKGIELNEEKSQ